MIIVKAKYSSTSKSTVTYMNYIATREGVIDNSMKLDASKPVSEKQTELIEKLFDDDLIDSNSIEYKNYMDSMNLKTASLLISHGLENADFSENEIYANYIAERPDTELNEDGSHGLFDLHGSSDLEATKELLKNHEGNVWKIIISLPYDSTFTSKEDWEREIRANDLSLKKAFNDNSIKWVGAVHKASNPHCHLMIWSDKNKLQLSPSEFIKMKDEIRRTFYKGIYKEELNELNKKQNLQNKDLAKAINKDFKQTFKDFEKNGMPKELNSSVVSHINSLSEKLPNKYGYCLSKDKQIINNILKEVIESNPSIKNQFESLLELQKERLSAYHQNPETIQTKLEEYKNQLLYGGGRNELQNAILKEIKELRKEPANLITPVKLDTNVNSLENQIRDSIGEKTAISQSFKLNEKTNASSIGLSVAKTVTKLFNTNNQSDDIVRNAGLRSKINHMKDLKEKQKEERLRNKQRQSL